MNDAQGVADTKAHRPLVLGLTGGIGSGKSAVSARLAELGVTIVDTDLISRELTQAGGAAIDAIRAAFGDTFIAADGAMDRAAMRALVFTEPAARGRLEAILHPLIRRVSDERVRAASGAYVVLAVPLLVESGHWVERCDRVVVVDCPEAMQLARVMARNGLAEVEVRAIMASQASRAERCAAAHEIIDNAGDFDSLRAQVDALHHRYNGASRSTAPNETPTSRPVR